MIGRWLYEEARKIIGEGYLTHEWDILTDGQQARWERYAERIREEYRRIMICAE